MNNFKNDLFGNNRPIRYGMCSHGNVTNSCPDCNSYRMDHKINIATPESMLSLGLNDLGKMIKKYREEIEVHTPSELNELMLAKLMRIVMEVSEAGEAVRNGDMSNFKEEIANVFMMLSDIAATVDFDVEEVIKNKIKGIS